VQHRGRRHDGQGGHKQTAAILSKHFAPPR
jgi:hypothetical protein